MLAITVCLLLLVHHSIVVAGLLTRAPARRSPAPITIVDADGQLRTATEPTPTSTVTTTMTLSRSAPHPREADATGVDLITTGGGSDDDDSGPTAAAAGRDSDAHGDGDADASAASMPETTPPPPSWGTSGGSGGGEITADGETFVRTTYYTCITLDHHSHCGWHEPVLQAGSSTSGGAGTRALAIPWRGGMRRLATAAAIVVAVALAGLA